MVGLRPATPGTVVVAAGTVLLALVSVSVPILKSIYFLSATIDTTVQNVNVQGGITLGVWGYCIDSKCSNSTLGYTLNVDQLFGISGIENFANLPQSLIKWLTYVLILHPVAAVLAGIATLFGLLAHLREMSSTYITTFFAGLASTVTFLAFVFDIVLFIIAKKRIESANVGGKASLGNAIWLTLAAWILLTTSGCFFGCGRRVISNRRSGRDTNYNKPVPDSNYTQAMRQEALISSSKNPARKEGELPVFADRDGEIIPLNSLPRHSDEWDDTDPNVIADQRDRYYDTQGQYDPYDTASDQYAGYGAPVGRGAANVVDGVGVGYGRRAPAPINTSAGATGVPASAAVAGGGAAAGLAGMAYSHNRRQNSGSHHDQPLSPARTEAFVGMNSSSPTSPYGPTTDGAYHATSPAAYGSTGAGGGYPHYPTGQNTRYSDSMPFGESHGAGNTAGYNPQAYNHGDPAMYDEPTYGHYDTQHQAQSYSPMPFPQQQQQQQEQSYPPQSYQTSGYTHPNLNPTQSQPQPVVYNPPLSPIPQSMLSSGPSHAAPSYVTHEFQNQQHTGSSYAHQPYGNSS